MCIARLQVRCLTSRARKHKIREQCPLYGHNSSHPANRNTMMATRSRFDDVAKLVDTEQGFISREIFVDPDLYKEELDKVFTRAWLFIGHESLIPNPGDFYTTRMGEESVILCRDKQGIVHAFLNSCRHRGMKVCR